MKILMFWRSALLDLEDLLRRRKIINVILEKKLRYVPTVWIDKKKEFTGLLDSYDYEQEQLR